MSSDLGWAVKNGDLDKVKDFIESQGTNVNVDIDGRSPLHYAADYGQTEVLQYLVSKGANINTKDKHGISVILAAIWEGHIDCVKFLIQKGCPKDGLTPDGTKYIDAAEKAEIKALLRS